MPNHTRTQPDGVWVDGYAPPAADWEDLERKVFGSWNGDRGGAYGVTGGGPYVIGGSGLHLTGPARLTHGGSVYGGTGAFVIADNTWPELGPAHAGRTRSIVQPIDRFASNRAYLWSRNHPYGGIGSVALACRLTYGRAIETPDMYVPLRVIDGSVLTKVAITFRVSQRRTYAPIVMPQFRVIRLPNDGSPMTYLQGTQAGDGFASPARATSGQSWYRDGTAQVFEYVCDQNNVIDASSYSYFVHIIEEIGVVSPEDSFDGVRLVERKVDAYSAASSAMPLNGFSNFDGILPLGRTLVTDPDPDNVNSSPLNGIYDVLPVATPWTRSADLDEPADFTPNWIIRVVYGTTNAGSTWQCDSPSTANRITLGSTPIRMVPAVPRGNIYHSMTPTFEIADLRFQ